RRKKGDIIAYALKNNGINDKEQYVIKGDRLHDIKGARENGISSIGVLYGFGSKEELTEAGAGSLAKDLEELKDILLKE
ncbi:HAD hydrolase-like protein, partial [Anaerocolumna jejuensis]|uniref:HAD hydrolase-like protein n=1 Tax=Anaerocolumna jejuensis TaxID=259063 RepID=UPI003F7CBEC7